MNKNKEIFAIVATGTVVAILFILIYEFGSCHLFAGVILGYFLGMIATVLVYLITKSPKKKKRKS